MKYFLRKSVLPFIYLFIMTFTAKGITFIENENLTWLKALLLVLNFGLYVFIVGALMFKEGEDAMGVRYSNDIERLEIIRTGADRPLNLVREYSPIKGFLIGITACIPLIICMLIHLILFFSGSAYTGMGAISEFLYFVANGVFFTLFCDLSQITMAQYFLGLTALPLIALTTGIAYVLGGKKREVIQERIKENQRKIYGDKN